MPTTTTHSTSTFGTPPHARHHYGAAVVVAAVMVLSSIAALTTGALPGRSSTSAVSTKVATTYQPSQAELAQWKALTATPAQRARIVHELQGAFAGVAQVGVGPIQTGTSAPNIQEVLSYGVNWDHFWIIASYYDMARGAIWGAVQVCDRYAPSWICNQAGNILSSWAAGWGWASNHGVWASIYWWPPHVTGGRW